MPASAVAPLSNPTAKATRDYHTPAWKAEMAALQKRDQELSLFEYWSTDEVAHDATHKLQRRIKAVPHHWKWSDLLPCIQKSGELVGMEESERRTLILMNPALAPTIATVTTMYAGYRVNLPHETAPAHKHSPNAVRVGLTGATNFTAVEGEHIVFGPGDLVLTPHDCWHSHGNDGSEPAINISYLDHPLVNSLNATYFDSELWVEENGKRVLKAVQDVKFPQDHSANTYRRGGLSTRTVSHHRGTGGASPMYVYRWEHTREFLHQLRDQDGTPYEGVVVDYTDPTTGGPVYKTMTFLAQMLRPGERTLPVQQNASQICTVLEGSGTSVVGGKTFHWSKFDSICIPGGEWYEHANSGKGDAIWMIATDEPALTALGLQVKRGRAPSGDVVRLDGNR
jgi:gentisate 1,2-dioxygenase